MGLRMLELIENDAVLIFLWLLLALLCSAALTYCLHCWSERGERRLKKLYDDVQEVERKDRRERIAAMVPAE